MKSGRVMKGSHDITQQCSVMEPMNLEKEHNNVLLGTLDYNFFKHCFCNTKRKILKKSVRYKNTGRIQEDIMNILQNNF